MEKGVYIIGTNTDIGKTFISGLILKKVKRRGKKCRVLQGSFKWSYKREKWINTFRL
nr:hypothetical protein [Clostridium perfringens]